jgi:hypothetical protein
MTTNWMTTRIRKITRPMTSEPPTTKWPNAAMTSPAYPPPRTRRVEATLRPSRNSVAISSSDGKIEKSSGRLTYIDVSRITSDPTMLTTISMSSSTGGSGTTSSMTIPTTPAGTARPAMFRFLLCCCGMGSSGMRCGSGQRRVGAHRVRASRSPSGATSGL